MVGYFSYKLFKSEGSIIAFIILFYYIKQLKKIFKIVIVNKY